MCVETWHMIVIRDNLSACNTHFLGLALCSCSAEEDQLHLHFLQLLLSAVPLNSKAHDLGSFSLILLPWYPLGCCLLELVEAAAFRYRWSILFDVPCQHWLSVEVAGSQRASAAGWQRGR